ncbi:hypothetical protein FHR22_000451 [Sphingopyxis panaciterrae]|nr:hypothetical protein [Sphingopyxis panaciterrae]
MRGSAVGDGKHTPAQILQNAFQIAHNVIVPVSDDLIASRLQARGPVDVGSIFGMLPAVRLDDNPQLFAQEVSNETGNGRLPAKFETKELARPKYAPKPLFGLGFRAPQFSRDWR